MSFMMVGRKTGMLLKATLQLRNMPLDVSVSGSGGEVCG